MVRRGPESLFCDPKTAQEQSSERMRVAQEGKKVSAFDDERVNGERSSDQANLYISFRHDDLGDHW
jgi:hypothetical protein